ncbi:MAG: hypothetical protein ACJA13_002917 [Paraglaciecola sp.]|jgi:hypothetical protein
MKASDLTRIRELGSEQKALAQHAIIEFGSGVIQACDALSICRRTYCYQLADHDKNIDKRGACSHMLPFCYHHQNASTFYLARFKMTRDPTGSSEL